MLRAYTTPCAPLPRWHDRRCRVGIRRGELGRPGWAEPRRHVPELELVPGGAEVPRLEPADCQRVFGTPGLGRMPDDPEFHRPVPALRDPRVHAVRVRLEEAVSLGAGDLELHRGAQPRQRGAGVRAQRGEEAECAAAQACHVASMSWPRRVPALTERMAAGARTWSRSR